MKYWSWQWQRITSSGNRGPVFRARKLWRDSLHSSPLPWDQAQRKIPSTGRALPATTTYGAQRKGRGPAATPAPWENAGPFGVSRSGALAKSKREEAHSSSQAVGFTFSDHPRGGRTGAQPISVSLDPPRHGNSAVKERNPAARPSAPQPCLSDLRHRSCNETGQLLPLGVQLNTGSRSRPCASIYRSRRSPENRMTPMPRSCETWPGVWGCQQITLIGSGEVQSAVESLEKGG